jgi:hypothetical protein
MGRPCAACSSAHHTEIDRKIKSGVTNADVSRWLKEIGSPITPLAIGRHVRDHLQVTQPRGPRPTSDDFLESVRDAAAAGLADGSLAVTLKDGLQAQRQLDERAAKAKDQDLLVRISMVLTGNVPLPTYRLDPEVEAIEAEFRPLLTAGD